MKRMICIAVAGLIVLGASMAAAQSLGDFARAARKTKLKTASTSSHTYDNDNLPKSDHLSVVGPEAPASTVNPASTDNPPAPATANAPASANPSAESGKAGPKDAKAEGSAPQTAEAALQKKIDDTKQKVDALNHELDLSQREYRLRVAAMYSDAGNRLRNAAQWDKEDAQYQQEIAEKQKAIEAAKQDLENAQEEARQTGLKQKDQE
jgi:hypothetical protein